MVNTQPYIELLKQLIATPSFSGEEDETARHIADHLKKNGFDAYTCCNNVYSYQKIDTSKPTLLLNSHHDTVKPASGYSKDPFLPIEEEGKLFGLGSNDAGGALVCLLATYENLKDQDLPFNLIFAASAEEENSGAKGMEMLLKELPPIDFAIVGEPTQMQLAIAEKGLMVLDCYTKGKSGHAAREEGENAIYKSIEDIRWFKNHRFPKVSPHLGEVKMSVTQINAGSQHNVVPDNCHFVVDVRVTDAYSLQDVLEEISANTNCEVVPRSLRLNSSGVPEDHDILRCAKEMNITTYGSPTLSDQALMPFPSVKMGPGDSARSHTADEFIYLKELEESPEIYMNLIKNLDLKFNTNTK